MQVYQFTAYDEAGGIVFQDHLTAVSQDDAVDLARIWFTMGVDRARAVLEQDGVTITAFERDGPRRSVADAAKPRRSGTARRR